MWSGGADADHAQGAGAGGELGLGHIAEVVELRPSRAKAAAFEVPSAVPLADGGFGDVGGAGADGLAGLVGVCGGLAGGEPGGHCWAPSWRAKAPAVVGGGSWCLWAHVWRCGQCDAVLRSCPAMRGTGHRRGPWAMPPPGQNVGLWVLGWESTCMKGRSPSSLHAVTHDDAPEGDEIGLFQVPINRPFAEAVAGLLRHRREIADKLPRPEDASPGSPFLRDIEWIDSHDEQLAINRGALYGMVIGVVPVIWDNVIDHLRALEHGVLMDPPPVWSPLTLSRVMLEGALLVHYLMDPSISPAVRLARGAGVWMTDARHALNSRSEYAEDEGAEARQHVAYVADCLDRAGVVVVADDRGRPRRFEVDGERAAPDINITAEAGRALPPWCPPAAYRLTSGAAHSRPWLIERGRSTESGGDGFGGEAATVMAALLTAMGSLDAGMRAAGGYFGIDMTDHLAELAETVQMFSLHAIGLAHATSPS